MPERSKATPDDYHVSVTEPWYLDELACPDCGLDLELDSAQFGCACGFSAAHGRQLDLRPQKSRSRSLEVVVGRESPALTDIDLERPAVTYAGPHAMRDSTELFSAAQSRLAPGFRMLDLGCGPRDQSVPASHLNLQYVGVDYDSPDADLLADGHAIPFRDRTFDAVLSYAVLEHLYEPALALREVKRVLRADGVFFGAVSQGEPFHDSYFHHTAWGVMASFHGAGLRVVRMWPSHDTLHALATMGRYARVVQALIEGVHRVDRAMPFLSPRKFFRGSKSEKEIDELHRAASVCFVAINPGSS
jgi:SAM-dependent methyltransferase